MKNKIINKFVENQFIFEVLIVILVFVYWIVWRIGN